MIQGLPEWYYNSIRDTTYQEIYGHLESADGTIHIDISDKIIVSGSVSINSTIIDNSELVIGAVIANQLNISIYTSINRYLLFDAKINLTCRVYKDDTEYTEVPLGEFIVSSADRVDSKVKLVAYDNIVKLDIPYGDDIYGQPFVVVNALAKRCGIELAENRWYYEELTNGKKSITINADSGCNTCRDVMAVVAQLCCGYFCATRDGKLSLRQFHHTPDILLTPANRLSSKLQDYINSYKQLQMTGIRGTFYSDNKEVTEGLVMQVKDAPCLDYGTDETLQDTVDQIMQELSAVSYTPAEMSIFSDPSIECGDLVELVLTDGTRTTSLITEYNWKYRGPTELISSGTNPYFQKVSTSQSATNRSLGHQTTSNVFTYHRVTNIEPVHLPSAKVESLEVLFVATDDTAVVFDATIQFEVEIRDNEGNLVYNLPANLIIKYWYDDSMFPLMEYKDTVFSGYKIETLHYPIQYVERGTPHTFMITVDAEMTIPDSGTYSIIIPENMFLGTISGQGLSEDNKWNGRIILADSIVKFNRTIYPVTEMVDAVQTEFNNKQNAGEIEQAITRIKRKPMSIL